VDRKEIHFVVDRDGTIQSTITGVKGSACSSIAAEIEKLGRVVRQERTQAFYECCDKAKNLLNLDRRKSDSADF